MELNFQRNERIIMNTDCYKEYVLHGTLGNVTHFDGDEMEEYGISFKNDDPEYIWVEFDNGYSMWIKKEYILSFSEEG